MTHIHRMLLMTTTLLSTTVSASSHAPSAPAAPPIPHAPGRLVAVNGTQLWLEEEGAGEPVVLLAGGPASSHVIFHPVFSRLARSFRVLYYDYRGRGRSHGREDIRAVSFAQDVEDLEGLRRALGLERLSLYGFSYGGLVAQAYALAHPERVRNLVLANTLWGAEMWQRNHENINRELENQYPELWERIEQLRAAGVPSSSPEMQQAFSVHGPLIRWYNPEHATRLLTEPGARNQPLYWSFVGERIDFVVGGEVARLPDFRPRLKELRMPVLILAGRFDRALYPKLQQEFRRAAHQARFVMLERSGSFGHLEEPETVFPLLEELLTSPLSRR
ncbi:MAG: alpha/beta hydrolase [Myxococcaceae bacterium]|nr:alpha/beta hydrolase [Myxococcaceae bacterium]MCI0673212.1 alpha/beta hydrolase [Myxococcaceae bacterium]